MINLCSYKNITTPIPILNKDYLIYEKRELLDDYNNKKDGFHCYCLGYHNSYHGYHH